MTVPAVLPDDEGGEPDRPQVVPDRDTILWNGQEWVPVSAYEALLAKLVSAGPEPEPLTPEQRAVEAIARSLHESNWCRCGGSFKLLLCLEAGFPVVTALHSLAETDPEAWAAAAGAPGVRIACTECGRTVTVPLYANAVIEDALLDGWTAPAAPRGRPPLLCPDCSKARQ